jgi:hypothetical protein
VWEDGQAAAKPGTRGTGTQSIKRGAAAKGAAQAPKSPGLLGTLIRRPAGTRKHHPCYPTLFELTQKCLLFIRARHFPQLCEFIYAYLLSRALSTALSRCPSRLQILPSYSRRSWGARARVCVCVGGVGGCCCASVQTLNHIPHKHEQSAMSDPLSIRAQHMGGWDVCRECNFRIRQGEGQTLHGDLFCAPLPCGSRQGRCETRWGRILFQ